MELESELQRQLEQASVSGSSVDSGKYDYRDLPTEFCFSNYSNNNTVVLQDPDFNQHVQATAHSLSL